MYKQTEIKGTDVNGRDISKALIEGGIAEILVQRLKNGASGRWKSAEIKDFDFWVTLSRDGTQHSVLLAAKSREGGFLPLLFPVLSLGLDEEKRKLIRGILDNAARELQNGVI